VRVIGVISALSLFAMLAAVTLPSVLAQEQPPIVRARGVIIVDDQGRDRILIGAPVPNPREGVRRSASTGIVINDPAGYERFGVGLTEDGQMGMGFDAPPGTGDPRNRERMNLVADASGGAYIRFLNRKTFVPGRLVLDGADQFYLEFLDFPEGKTVSRRIAFGGEQTTERPR
jgi:hypothetical protein